MKANIHPTYNTDTTVTCACGNAFKVGSTMKEINIEICSTCHPFWTGQEKVLDTQGRVDRFKKRAAKTTTSKKK